MEFPKSDKFEKLYELRRTLMVSESDKKNGYKSGVLSAEEETKIKEDINKLSLEVKAENRKLHSEFLQEIFNGKHGRGELFLVRGVKPNNISIHRLLFICSGEWKGGKVVNQNTIYWRNIPNNVTKYRYADEVNGGFLWSEVGIEEVETTTEEWNQFFITLKRDHDAVELLEVFPADFEPELQVGDELTIASELVYHKGLVSYKATVLPSKRLVIVIYVNSSCKCLGVINNIRWQPEFSIRDAEFVTNSTMPLTNEEFVFLEKNDLRIGSVHDN